MISLMFIAHGRRPGRKGRARFGPNDLDLDQVSFAESPITLTSLPVSEGRCRSNHEIVRELGIAAEAALKRRCRRLRSVSSSSPSIRSNKKAVKMFRLRKSHWFIPHKGDTLLAGFQRHRWHERGPAGMKMLRGLKTPPEVWSYGHVG